MTTHLQPILGVDKNNPHFTIFKDTNKNQIQVYFGAGLYDILPDEKYHPQLKLLAARLFLFGVSSRKLTKAFGYCYRTLKELAGTIETGDLERQYRLLEGVNIKRKMSKEIEGYVSHRFKSIYPENKRTYSKIIRQELKEVFKLDISGETLRPLFNQLKEPFQDLQKKTL